jgi:predicted SnoaL-like aldol condensation-catalyzing enzyme
MNPEQKGLSHKDQAISFLQLVAAGNVREAFQEHIGTGFSHHNAYFRGDAESLMLAMEESEAMSPNKVFEIKQMIEENDLVVVHSHIKQNPEDLGAAVVHICRFENDKIIELWDLGQPILENSPNENGMF